MMTSDIVDRARGAVVGVHAGDSLGATLEFQSAEECRAQYPEGLRDIIGGGAFGWAAGEPTDDTDLTWALARGYLDAGFDTGAVVRAGADRMREWFAGGPADIGGTTRAALTRYQRTGDPLTSGSADDRAQANGSLMRTMPVALARLRDPATRAAEARALSAVTHAHPACLDACVVYCDIAAALIQGVEPRDAVVGALDDSGVHDGVRAAVHEAAAGDAFRFDDLTGPQGGYVLWALKVAVRAALFAPGVEDGVVGVVMLGDDADTNGAIAGGLLGARDGLSRIPQQWVRHLRLADALVAFADAAVGPPAGG